MTTRIVLAATAVAVLSSAGTALAHCEIPCGIYGDQMRIHMLHEHFATVEKSMRSIEALGSSTKPSWNQLGRWITNKDEHADKIQEIVSQYFLTQRVKVPSKKDKSSTSKYAKQLSLLHQLLVAAMKMKQTTDLETVAAARGLVKDFAGAYFSKADLEHLRKHD
jgi:nickel superoxide dismutase